MSTFGELIVSLFSIWKEMFSAIWGAMPKVFSVSLWVLTAIFILPCVFITSVIYPKWIEWGEDF